MKIELLKCKNPNICKHCGSEFPNWILVDGVRKNLSTRSYCLGCKPYSSGNTKRLSRYREINGHEQKLCSVCQKWKDVEYAWYKVTRGDKVYTNSHCKDCTNARSRCLAADLKRKAVNYKGEKCYDCGELFPDYIYDFHHRDPSAKDFKVSNHLTRNMDWQKVKDELDKCDMLCSNCHRHRHYDKDNPNYCPTR